MWKRVISSNHFTKEQHIWPFRFIAAYEVSYEQFQIAYLFCASIVSETLQSVVQILK